MDRTTLLGLLLGGLAVLGGNYLEGGSTAMIFQITAAVIVLGGTAGAVCLSFPAAQILQSLKSLPRIFRPPPKASAADLGLLVQWAYRARREGLLALEDEVADIPEPFLRRGLQLVIDGFPPPQLREILELELARQHETGLVPARVFEAAGGYAPTIGILGAVLGLIQVMQHLTDPARLGTGVAVAFVATIYGVAAANLVFLPIAHKLRLHHEEHMFRLEMLLEGILALAQGEHPRLIAERLTPLLPPESPLELHPPAPVPLKPLPDKSPVRSKAHASSQIRSH